MDSKICSMCEIEKHSKEFYENKQNVKMVKAKQD